MDPPCLISVILCGGGLTANTSKVSRCCYVITNVCLICDKVPKHLVKGEKSQTGVDKQECCSFKYLSTHQRKKS